MNRQEHKEEQEERMAKVIDITERLDFDGNPIIKIKDVELEVNADASTMLKVLGILSKNDNSGPKEVLDMYELIFSKAVRSKIEKMGLNFKDFTKLVYAAINLVNGEEDGQGGAVTRTMI